MRVIREAFAERVQRSKALQSMLQDLGELSGVKIQFVEASDRCVRPCAAHSPLCRRLGRAPDGESLCRDACLRVLEDAQRGDGTSFRCAAGTTFCAAPIRSSVGLLGFLVASGFYEVRPTARERNRIRHLLERAGVKVSAGEIARDCAATKIVPPSRRASLAHMLEMAAGYAVKALSLELFQKGGDLPQPIKRACKLIRESFREDPSLEQIARASGLSPSHFSRVFHRRTGLRFKEYVNEVRLQSARRALRETDAPVTSVAFDAGYRSISQFNRQFKDHHGVSPRDYRKRYR